jgi:FkbM family methyltransferase
MSLKENIRNTLTNYPYLFNTLRRIYHFPKYRIPKEESIVNILNIFAKNNSDVVFVQVGSNNGLDKYTDFRINYSWTSILVEPQKEVYKELKNNNKENSNTFIMNAAISDTSEVRKLFKLGVSSSWWATGIASFNKEHIIRHIEKGWLKKYASNDNVELPEDIKNIDDYIIEEDVECITITDLLLKFNISKIDILVVDTEGHDYNVIKSIDFNKILPQIIIFEYANLTKNDYKNCIKLLKYHNYHFFSDEVDIIAILNEN